MSTAVTSQISHEGSEETRYQVEEYKPKDWSTHLPDELLSAILTEHTRDYKTWWSIGTVSKKFRKFLLPTLGTTLHFQSTGNWASFHELHSKYHTSPLYPWHGTCMPKVIHFETLPYLGDKRTVLGHYQDLIWQKTAVEGMASGTAGRKMPTATEVSAAPDTMASTSCDQIPVLFPSTHMYQLGVGALKSSCCHAGEVHETISQMLNAAALSILAVPKALCLLAEDLDDPHFADPNDQDSQYYDWRPISVARACIETMADVRMMHITAESDASSGAQLAQPGVEVWSHGTLKLTRFDGLASAQRLCEGISRCVHFINLETLGPRTAPHYSGDEVGVYLLKNHGATYTENCVIPEVVLDASIDGVAKIQESITRLQARAENRNIKLKIYSSLEKGAPRCPVCLVQTRPSTSMATDSQTASMGKVATH